MIPLLAISSIDVPVEADAAYDTYYRLAKFKDTTDGTKLVAVITATSDKAFDSYWIAPEKGYELEGPLENAEIRLASFFYVMWKEQRGPDGNFYPVAYLTQDSYEPYASRKWISAGA